MKNWIRTRLGLSRDDLAVSNSAFTSNTYSHVLKIGFMTTLGVNVGDEFIREGIRAVLDRIGVPYEPLYVNKHDPHSLIHPHEEESLIVRDKYWDCDIFMQAGAPV